MKLLRPFLGIVSLILLVSSILLLNLIQVSTILLWPISAKLVREINRFCAGAWFWLLDFCVQKILRVKYIRSGESLPKKENVFLLCNHQAMADIPAIIAVACECRRQQDTKWFVKDPIKWVPGIGWGMLFMDCLFVKRNWMADKEKVTNTFARLKNSGAPFWVISFAEGTRSTPSKVKRSQDFAKKAGLPILNHVLLPRTKGFEVSLDSLDKIEAVYDLTLGYEGRPPKIWELFFTPVERIHIHVKRHAITEVPKTNEARSKWLVDRFVEKEKMLADFQSRLRFGQ